MGEAVVIVVARGFCLRVGGGSIVDP
jgi:hypothetical protein